MCGTGKMGYSSLKDQQESVIRHVLSVCDPTNGKWEITILLPVTTGVQSAQATAASGNSLVVIVVSPLNALMKDQVRSLREKSVRSAYVGEANESSEVYAQTCGGV